MKKILVLIDCQNDFISGSLANEEAKKVVPNIVKKITEGEWNEIIYTIDTHQENYLETMEGKALPVKHCIQFSDGWKIDDKINDAMIEWRGKNNKVALCVGKKTFGSIEDYDCYYSLVNTIKSTYPLKKTEKLYIEFVGFCTDICVISNVLITKASYPETAKIVVDASCCAGTTIEKHKAALDVMESCQIEIINK